MSMSAGKLWGLRRLADLTGRFRMLAVDQRPPIKTLIRERRGLNEAPFDDVAAVKAALVRRLAPESSAVLLDPHGAYPSAVHLVSPAQGLIVTLEDSLFKETSQGRLSEEIENWSVAKIKRTGADAVKVLTWYRPDAAREVLVHQKDFARRIGEACRRYDLPYVFELLVYPLPGEAHQTTDYVEHRAKRVDLVLDSVREFAKPEYGVDLFKLESPLPADSLPDPDDGSAAAEEAQAAFDELGRIAGRPWVMLSAGAGKEAFRRVLGFAYRAGASGYLAGRAIWWSAFQSFPDMKAMDHRLAVDAVPYMRMLNALTESAAPPWHLHPSFGTDGPQLAGEKGRFRESYGDFEAKR